MKEIEITFMGIPLRVEGIYIPEEQMVMYYPDGSGYPGSASNFDVNGVYAVDSEIDIFEIFSEIIIPGKIEVVKFKIEKL